MNSRNDLMERLSDWLAETKAQGLYRELKYLEAPQTARTLLQGREILLLASNSYLGLADEPLLKEAAHQAIRQYGVGAGGSRLTTGSYRVHQLLEQQLAEFKLTEAALLFNTGYMANLGTIAALTDRDWVIFCDRLNHASIIDGCRLSGAKLVIYKHCDLRDLEKKLQRYQGTARLLVTDGVFSMDGDLAPLDQLVSLAKKHQVLTMVDDAHATGVLGAHGGGTVEYFGLQDQVEIQMGTLSKALASEGGYVAGKQVLIDYLRHRAKSFVYSTALAPATVVVASRALELVRERPELRSELLEKAAWLRQSLRELGFQVNQAPTPIIPLLLGDASLAVRFSERLLEEGIYVPAIRPPTVPSGTSRLRFSLMATHTFAELELVLMKMKLIGRELGVI